jgi:HK97 family phage major capsid protein
MERVSDLLKAGDVYKAHGGVELARELIGDPAATVDNFNRQILERMRASGSKPTATAEPGITSPYGSGARHMLRFGAKPKAFRAPILFSDGSKMEPLEAAYRSGQWLLATVAQNQKAARWCRDHGVDIEHRVMQTASSSLGGYLVPDEMEQSIIDLRESYGLARRLARRRVMGSDTKSIPKRTGGVTAYFIEEDNSGVTAADKSWGNVNLVAKTLAALTLISKNLEEDAVIDVVDDLAQEQAWAFAQKEDACWLNGDGTSTYGGMTGIITLMNATAYTSRFNAAANHDTYAEYDSSDLAGVMSGVADYAGVNPVWVCSKAFAEAVMNRIKAAAGGNTIATMQGRPTYNYLGYDVYTSELMHKDVTGDSSDTTIALFGDFGLSSAFGDRRGIMVEVLRERYAEKLQVGILAHERFSIVNHDLGSTTARGPVAALYGD